MSKIRTSTTHPLQIAEVASPTGGSVGVTFCPGKHQTNAWTGSWARDLVADVAAIRRWGAEVVVTLVTPEELTALRVERLGQAVSEEGMAWLHLPIPDVTAPTPAWEALWAGKRARVHEVLDAGGKVLVHCKGGLGRAGTVAALILVERGLPAGEAVEAIRQARPGALETRAQEAFVMAHTGAWRRQPEGSRWTGSSG